MGYLNEARLQTLLIKLKEFVIDKLATKEEIEEKYSIPSTGIPEEDLSEELQQSIAKGDSSLQPDDIAEWAKESNKPTYTYDEVEGSATTDKITVVLRADSWLSSIDDTATTEIVPCYQTIDGLDKIKEYMYPFADIDRSELTASNVNDVLTSWASVDRIETGEGTITATCLSAVPTEDLTLIIKIVEQKEPEEPISNE